MELDDELSSVITDVEGKIFHRILVKRAKKGRTKLKFKFESSKEKQHVLEKSKNSVFEMSSKNTIFCLFCYALFFVNTLNILKEKV